MWTKDSLADLIQTRFRGYRLILVSNREPYSHQYKGWRSGMHSSRQRRYGGVGTGHAG